VKPPEQLRPAGRFTFDVSTGKWDWDDEVYRIHGYQPGALAPTTQLILDRTHPEDRGRVTTLLAWIRRTSEPASTPYRLAGADGVERRVVLVGEGGVVDPEDQAPIAGYYIDLTADYDQEVAEAAHAAVVAAAEHRAVIEQAKGILILVYGLDPEAAFAMLRWWSRSRNIKIRDLADRLVTTAHDKEVAEPEMRTTLDALLHDLTTG
jgi:hypothetical protein